MIKEELNQQNKFIMIIFTLILIYSVVSTLGLQIVESQEESVPVVGVSNSLDLTSQTEHDIVEVTVFDLYLSDTFQGSILVRYTEEWFEIDDPKDLAEQIKGVKDYTQVEKLVSGRLAKVHKFEGVGSVRYDLRTFRIIVDLDPSLLPEKRIDLLNRLPDPENLFSLQQLVGGASSGQLDKEYKSSITNRTLASQGKYFGIVNGTGIQDSDYVLTEASVGGIVGDYQVRSGLLESRGQAFASSVDIAGVGFETSEDIFLDQDNIRGSKLEVFIPSRSRVEFFREDRLLQVQVLDFGLQEVDTRQFPDGSYDVEIIINEDNGNITRERRFFTKSGYLAIQSRPIFFLQAGQLRDQLDLIDTSIYEGGFRWRANSFLELKGSNYGSDNINITELETVGVFRELLFGSLLSLSNKGDSGVGGNISGRVLGIGFDLNASKTLSGGLRPDQSDIVFDSNGRAKLSPQARGELISPERSTYSAGISKSFGKTSLRFSANRNERPLSILDEEVTPENPLIRIERESRYAVGPKFEWRIIENQISGLRFDLSYLNTDEGSKLGASLNFRYSFGPRWTTSSDLFGRKQSSGNEAGFRNTLTYDSKDRTGRGSRAIFSNEPRYQEEPKSDSYVTDQFYAEHTNDYLQGLGFIRDIQGSSSDTTDVGVNAESSFLYSQDGGFSVSYPAKEEAIFIADVQAGDSISTFDLIVNGQTYAVIEGGKRTVIGLQPYKRYQIVIRPTEGKELVNFDSKVYDVTLFPGNVIRKTWKVERIVIGLGRLVDNKGEPIGSRRIKGTREYTVTEPDGTFQVELKGDEKLYIDSKDLKCQINFELPQDIDVAYVQELGDVTCQ